MLAERKHGPHIFHPFSYTLSCTHGNYKWNAITSFKEVHKTLVKIVKSELGSSLSDISKEDIKSDWPIFPTEHDHLVSMSQINERCKKIADYIEKLLTYPPYRDHPAVLNLLGVSSLSFITDLGSSLVEGTFIISVLVIMYITGILVN